jgi:hypothetical protein
MAHTHFLSRYQQTDVGARASGHRQIQQHIRHIRHTRTAHRTPSGHAQKCNETGTLESAENTHRGKRALRASTQSTCRGGYRAPTDERTAVTCACTLSSCALRPEEAEMTLAAKCGSKPNLCKAQRPSAATSSCGCVARESVSRNQCAVYAWLSLSVCSNGQD